MKVLAVASGGGHWVELLRLRLAFEGQEVIYMSTNESFRKTVPESEFVVVPEVSRWDKLKLISSIFKMYSIIKSLKPDTIITTGAAPGVLSLFIGKLLGCKTIWVESMCHAGKISISGKMAKKFASRVYTQYPHLATNGIIYSGNIMS